MTQVQGTAVDVPVQDGTADAYLAHPADGGPHPGVLFYTDAFGVRPHVRAMADRLAGAGYTVLVPNLFHRHGGAPVVDLPEVIGEETRGDLWKRLRPILRSLTPDLAMRDAAGYLAWLADSPLVTPGKVALTGYCVGARLSLLTAGTYPDRIAAAAGFHGGRLATEDPDSPHLVAPAVTAELYFGHADDDPSLPPEQIQRLESALTEAGVRHHSEVYTGAHHGYTQSDTTSYDKESDERHWSALLALLERTYA
ncbi:dienelactone hydrolase family protein [Streptomyces sp. NPDC059477]|uniref:dienelactone hydrolase family protein n=1 Tax=Streptomyces sp. NPDC059477 TaxID=3346847 RepID=UPI0036CD5E43